MPSDEVLEGSVFLPLETSKHLCIQDFVFTWVQLGQLSEHHPCGGRVLYGISHRQAEQTNFGKTEVVPAQKG